MLDEAILHLHLAQLKPMPVTRSQKQSKPSAARQKSTTRISPSPVDIEDASPEPASDSEVIESAGNNKHVQNAKSPHWQAWQDRYLAKEVFAERPFLVGHRGAASAWDALAAKLLEDIMRDESVIDRTGAACRGRFRRLVKAHNKDNTRSLQKTGTDEQVDEHVKIMTDLVALVNEHQASKEEFTRTSKRQQVLQQKAAEQMRDASTTGCVPRKTLADVAQLDGATVREKQGQRKRKSTQSSAHSGSEKENIGAGACKRARHQSAIKKALIQHEETDQKQLKEVLVRDDQRHKELRGGLDRMADSITQLSDAVRIQSDRETERNAQQMELMKMVNTLLQNQVHNWYA
ncbi:hypothetical protein M422DRAFT_252912 [Sphaerobolus stellatus SS14]|uniref:Myb-like domain-containing protein n=1 Tax=Sphaerobolus stellatus (strain SS14) TaxID=990650 RepID=A0A0C9VYT3_SPHS4|nr:hypothetical protein M422DRAFT_252912 [Sphaerobolus stellatus SS14]